MREVAGEALFEIGQIVGLDRLDQPFIPLFRRQFGYSAHGVLSPKSALAN
jgi:hypothetical protein